MKAVAEPLRPGWYPAGDRIRQRYYGGTDRGWTNDYILEIDVRDPRRISCSAADARDLAIMAWITSISMLIMVAGAAMVAIVA